MSRSLEAVAGWVAPAAAAVVTPEGTVEVAGPQDLPLRWASVTKVLAAMAAWIAVEEGTIELDQPAGPRGATVRHLLAHASGLAFDNDAVLARPGTRRIYSNRGIEVLAEVVEAAAEMPFEEYVTVGVLEPLGMTGTTLDGSPAAGAVGPVRDLARLASELLRPTLVSADTARRATAVTFPELGGVLPGFGRQVRNDWGLGVEVRGHKQPHWTPPTASSRTFGHFGQAGGFLWVDPVADVGCVVLTARDFGQWAVEAWPALGAVVLATHGRR